MSPNNNSWVFSMICFFMAHCCISFPGSLKMWLMHCDVVKLPLTVESRSPLRLLFHIMSLCYCQALLESTIGLSVASVDLRTEMISKYKQKAGRRSLFLSPHRDREREEKETEGHPLMKKYKASVLLCFGMWGPRLSGSNASWLLQPATSKTHPPCHLGGGKTSARANGSDTESQERSQ